MKKVVFTLVIFFVLAIGFSGCRSADKCPAYGNVEKYQVDRP
jgi:hypothetical protein